jgi:hypothetical protein
MKAMDSQSGRNDKEGHHSLEKRIHSVFIGDKSAPPFIYKG